MLIQLAFLGPQEVLIVVAVGLVLFGATRLPKLARAMGQSVSEFKKGVRESQNALKEDDDDEDDAEERS